MRVHTMSTDTGGQKMQSPPSSTGTFFSAVFHSELSNAWLVNEMRLCELHDLALAYAFHLSDPVQGSALQGKECNTYSRRSCHIICEGRLMS